MSAKLSPEAALALRKQLILGRSAALRASLATQSQQLRPSLFLIDKLRGVGLWMLKHPRLAMGLGSVLMMAYRQGLLARGLRLAWPWVARGYGAWRIWRQVSAKLNEYQRSVE